MRACDDLSASRVHLVRISGVSRAYLARISHVGGHDDAIDRLDLRHDLVEREYDLHLEHGGRLAVACKGYELLPLIGVPAVQAERLNSVTCPKEWVKGTNMLKRTRHAPCTRVSARAP